MNPLDESGALHARVLAFARASLEGLPHEPFDALAVDIARHQMRCVPGFRRLVEAFGGAPASACEIPPVPVDAFRVTRVAAHPPELDAARFVTSGTTGSAAGVHAMRVTSTYRELCLAWGRRALLSPAPGPRTVVALAPAPGEANASSLGFMMQAFMDEFDGRDAAHARWLAGPTGVDVEGLKRALAAASSRKQPLLVLATGFALVFLLDALAGGVLPAPEDTVIMVTGGFKGRTREVSPLELSRDVARAFGVPEARLVGEYGMTELSSQLYEGTLPGGALRGERGVFLPPPWLRVTPVDPESLKPVPDGKDGIARFVDLGNVDSAVAVVTQDRVRARAEGIELLGRRPGAPPRGCSLAVEEMVLGSGAT